MSKEKTVSKPLGGLYANPTEEQKQELEASQKDTVDVPLEEKQAPSAPPAPHLLHKGEFDGKITISFRAGNGYKHNFTFALPNVFGTLGVAGMNDEAITAIIEKALIEKLGSGGVVRVKEG